MFSFRFLAHSVSAAPCRSAVARAAGACVGSRSLLRQVVRWGKERPLSGRFSIGSAPDKHQRSWRSNQWYGETRQDPSKDIRRFPRWPPKLSCSAIRFGSSVSFRCYGCVYRHAWHQFPGRAVQSGAGPAHEAPSSDWLCLNWHHHLESNRERKKTPLAAAIGNWFRGVSLEVVRQLQPNQQEPVLWLRSSKPGYFGQKLCRRFSPSKPIFRCGFFLLQSKRLRRLDMDLKRSLKRIDSLK